MIPDKHQLWGWGVLWCVSLVGAWQHWALSVQFLPLLLWLTVLAIAAWRLYRAGDAVIIIREAVHTAAVGQVFTMTLQVQNRSGRRLPLCVYDHYPQSFSADDMPVSLTLDAGQTATLTYQLRAQRRGAFRFAGVQVRYPGQWRFWQRNTLLALPHDIRVFPVFAKGSKRGFRSIGLPHFGYVHPLHSHSGNGDFDHLRTYRSGDALNRIDHKATARLGEPVSREYVFEHNQPVALLLDCSRRLGLAYERRTLLDEVLNAAVLLAQTAVEQGDEIGLSAFSATPRRYLPVGQRRQYARLMEQLYDLYADERPPDFLAAAQDYYRKQRKSSLIIMITVLQDGDETAIRAALHLLRRRHHVLLVSLRPPFLDMQMTIDSPETAAAAAMRDDYANRFAAMQQQLSAGKLWFVQCRPEQLRVQLVNAYLKYKRLLKG